MKKLLCILLSAAMMLSVASCSSTPAEDGGNDAGGDNGGDSADAGDVTQYDIVVNRWTDAWPTDFMDSGIMAELEEKHGVDIVWDVYFNADWAEQKALLLGANNDLPDAFWGSITLNDTDVTQNKPAFLELTDLIEANMPNLTKIFSEVPEMYAVSVDRNGEIYSLPKQLPLRPVVGDLMFINQTWLDNLGLEMPTNIDELETVLTAFVNDDPNGNGENDEYGYSYQESLDGALRHILLPFGTMVSRAGNYMGMIDDAPVFMPIEDNYKEAAIWYQGLYEQGLIDTEVFTQDGSLYDGKTKGEDGALVGITFGWTADAQVGGTNMNDFAVVSPIAGPDGQRYAESDPSFLDLSRNELILTINCEDPAKLLQWADEFYTDEVTLQTYYGSVSEGKITETDGQYELLIPDDGMSLDTSAWSFSFRDHGPKYMDPAFYENVTLPTEQGDGVKLAMEDEVKEFAAETFPVVSYTDEQNIELATLKTDITDYVENTFARWISDSSVDIEAEWADYLAQLDAMGLQRYIEIQTEAYDVYMENIG